jgi:hypothetical protein
MQHAPVYRISLAEHRNADPSVPSTPNVAPTLHANATNALTLVLAHVALSPHVGWLTTSQCVLALPVTLVIPSAGVHPLQVRFAPTFPPLYFYIFCCAPHYIIICREQSLYLCQCTFSVVSPVEAPRDPCNPSPCGANAICKERNGAGACMCMREFFGDPYTGCRPECVLNTDCSRDKACVNNKCKNPCIGTCGINAECRVINHAPSCSCYPGYIGDPLNACHQRQGNCKFCIPKRGAHFASQYFFKLS